MSAHPVLPDPGEITVYATSWCPYCALLLADLRNGPIRTRVVDVERDDDAARYVESVNGGERVVPTVVYPGGSVETNPTSLRVRAVLAG